MVPNWGDKVYNLAVDLASIFTQHPYSIQLDERMDSHDEYDYIVIGAGAAGCVVAARLSEIPDNRVLVLEAGGEESGFTRMATIGHLYWNSRSIHWNYPSEPEKYGARAFIGHQVRIPIAKLLGGGTAHNGLMWNRGDPRDYDRWAQLGAQDWDYAHVFPYFVKMENLSEDQIGFTPFDKGYHGTRGPIGISGSFERGVFTESLIRGAQEIGYKTGDPNGRDHSVFSYIWNNLSNGTRGSMVDTYLAPVSFRPNLDIFTNAFVHRINFGPDKRAVSVTYEKDGKVRQVRARKEIILSAGSSNSPKILMLSGIGPKKQLEKHQIKVVSDLPGVGQNLRDHIGARLFFTMKANLSLVYTQPEEYIESARSFVTNRTGRFASLSDIVQGNFRTKYALDSRADLSIITYAGLQSSFNSNFFQGFLNRYKPEVIEKFFAPQAYKQGFAIGLFSMRTLSRGKVSLRSSNPHDDPILENRYFEVERDLDAMVEGCKIALKIVNSKAMQDAIAPKPFPNTLPGCEQYIIGSDAYCRCYILSLTISGIHISGTCKMGSVNDLMAVVDPELRVKGVKGLRIIDASIMPESTSGNTNAPTIMIAERGSDLIKGKTLRPSLPPFRKESEVLRYS
ncbi:oxygen-dependent choline dehydrogenase-like [Brevipalpus obovatus]|uniref:oxygen-dependent choline dehydrogenase-like n=1 Tax=Brevipalpus obovatus TaxID=246614 RepID=UPI003D9F73AC